MTDTQTQAPASANGTAPVPPADPSGEDTPTGGEKALAVVAGLFGLFIIGMAVDMFTGGRLSRFLGRAAGEPGGD
jgi:hypothetical protein